MRYEQPDNTEVDFTIEEYSEPDNNNLVIPIQGLEPIMQKISITSGNSMPPSMTESGANIMLNYGPSSTEIEVRNIIGGALSSNSQGSRASGYSPTPNMEGFYFVGSGQNIRARSIKDSTLKGQVQRYYGTDISSFSVSDGAVLASTEASTEGASNQHHTVLFGDLTKGNSREKFTISRGLYSCPFYPLMDSEAIYQVSDDGTVIKIPGESPENELLEDTSEYPTSKIDLRNTGDLSEHEPVPDPGHTAPSTVWNVRGRNGSGSIYHNGKIFFQDVNNTRCYNAYTGEQIWASGDGDGELVILEDKGVIIGSTYERVKAYDLDTGDEVWEILLEDQSSGLARDSNENIYTEYNSGSYSTTLMKADSDGNILWTSSWSPTYNELPHIPNVVVVEDKGLVMAGGMSYLQSNFDDHEVLAWWDIDDGTVVNDDDGTHLGGGTANYSIASSARWIHHPDSNTVIIPSNHGHGPTCISGWPDDPADGRTDKWRIRGFNGYEGALEGDIYYQHFGTSGGTYDAGHVGAWDISGGSPTELWVTDTGLSGTGNASGFVTQQYYICPMGGGVMWLDKYNGEVVNFITPTSSQVSSMQVSSGGVFCGTSRSGLYSIGREV